MIKIKIKTETITTMNRSIFCTLLLSMLLIYSVGCSSGSPHSISDITPVMAIAASAGSPQSHAVNGAFGSPLSAMVTSNGLPASGVVVTFTAPSTGASGTFADTGKITTSAKSDASGIATPAAFTANAIVGTYSVNASAPGAPTAASFTLSNTVGAPAIMSVTSGSSQSAQINNAFANPLQATVLDSGKNPVSNAIVVFTAPGTGASGTFTDPNNPNGGSAASTLALTDANGIATSTTFTANSIAGSDNVLATVAGVSKPADFSLSNLPGGTTIITATSGTPQTAIGGQPFRSVLTATVTDNQNNPVQGVTVTFAAPSTGASGTFTVNGVNSNSMTGVTNSNGIASSTTFTANTTSGTYNLTATAGSGPANFTLTNWPVGTQYFSFYLSGQEYLQQGSFSGLYALAGSVVIDPTGNVLGGEQDYNDGFFTTSPQPTGDIISGGSLKIGTASHQGTLTLNTSNLNIGVGGLETLAIQYLNSNHALISQFDGSATSSGSLDLQTLPSTAASSNLSGGYAFTLAGIDPVTFPVAFGGVFTIAGGGATLQNGLIDINDFGTGLPPVLDTPFSGTLSLPDAFGRGTITTTLNYTLTGTPTPITLNYYIVGPEAVRIIVVDTSDFAIGSAYGQGTNSSGASTASLGTSIFGVAGNNSYSSQYGAVGMFNPNSSAATFSGVADDNEIEFGLTLPASPIAGTYSVATNGYGSITIAAGNLGDVSSLGLYLSDPTLNLLDPNNRTSGQGGALLVDLDSSLAGGVGLVIPQTDTSTSSFAGSYGFSAQDENFFSIPAEFDFIGGSNITAGAINGVGELSDPVLTLGGNATDFVKIVGTPQPDSGNPGRYTMSSNNSTPNPLVITVKGNPLGFNVAMYQASGNQLFWLDEDSYSVFFGTLQGTGTFNAMRQASRKSK